jgi:sugar phosphate isomerase/epimerase
MKQILYFIFFVFLFGCSTPEKKLNNTFYCFANAGNLLNAPEEMEAKAALFKELGYDGWGGHYGAGDYLARRAALDKAGLKMPEIYWNLDIDSTGVMSFKEGLKEAIMDSQDRGLLVTFIIRADFYQENQAEGDPFVVKAIQELADFAAPFGVKIAAYPHVNVYCETTEHSLRLAKMADRENVGAVFNLCHLLKAEGAQGWEQKLSDALPLLYMISICGADEGDTKEMGWDRLIQPLGEGSFDTYKVVKFAKDKGYEGPFGLQCYNIKQDAEVAMTTSINTWHDYQVRYRDESPAEFIALFDGKTSKGWRGINSDAFPEEAWKIENGNLIVNATGGAESGSGGDIITIEKFGDFELRWEWKMLTKGGNILIRAY